MPDSTWSGEAHSESDFEDDEDGIEEWKSIKKNGEKALILVPVN